MMLRSLAVAALTLAGFRRRLRAVGLSVRRDWRSVYVTPTPNGPYYNGAPAVYPGTYPGPYAPPAGGRRAAFAVLSRRGRAAGLRGARARFGLGYDAPLAAYGAAPGVLQRRIYVEEPARPPAPVPYGRRRGWWT